MHVFVSHLFFFSVACSSHTLQLTRQSGVTLACLQTTVAIKSHFLRPLPLRGDKATWNSFRGISVFQLWSSSFVSSSERSPRSQTHGEIRLVYLACLLYTTLPQQMKISFSSKHRTQCNNKTVRTSHSTTRLLSLRAIMVNQYRKLILV